MYLKLLLCRIFILAFAPVMVLASTRLALSTSLFAMSFSSTMVAALATSTATLPMTTTFLLGIVLGSFAQPLGERKLVYFTADELFNGGKARLVIHGYKGNGTAIGTSTSCATYTVYVVLAVARSIVVDDEAYIVYVDTA